jgi:hypothetical protein
MTGISQSAVISEKYANIVIVDLFGSLTSVEILSISNSFNFSRSAMYSGFTVQDSNTRTFKNRTSLIEHG